MQFAGSFELLDRLVANLASETLARDTLSLAYYSYIFPCASAKLVLARLSSDLGSEILS